MWHIPQSHTELLAGLLVVDVGKYSTRFFSKIVNKTSSSLSMKFSVTGFIFLLIGYDHVLAISA